jgi:hypothetical protein
MQRCNVFTSIDYFVENKTLLIIQYLFDENEHPVTPAPHGNSRKISRLYVRTKPSTLSRVKKVTETSGPKV